MFLSTNRKKSNRSPGDRFTKHLTIKIVVSQNEKSVIKCSIIFQIISKLISSMQNSVYFINFQSLKIFLIFWSWCDNYVKLTYDDFYRKLLHETLPWCRFTLWFKLDLDFLLFRQNEIIARVMWLHIYIIKATLQIYI